MTAPVLVRRLAPDDHDWAVATLVDSWGSTAVVRKDERIETADLPGHVAMLEDRRAGLVVTAVRADEYEVVGITALVTRKGVGRRLMEACFDEARSLGCRRVWLTTTNNNVAAFGFYQHVGMDLSAFYRHGVASARHLKPAIPPRDADGLPVDHELEFELVLGR